MQLQDVTDYSNSGGDDGAGVGIIILAVIVGGLISSVCIGGLVVMSIRAFRKKEGEKDDDYEEYMDSDEKRRKRLLQEEIDQKVARDIEQLQIEEEYDEQEEYK